MVTGYVELKRHLARGWNTWNTRSVLSHVLLPSGFALNLGLKDGASRRYLKEALIGRLGDQDEQIFPGPRTYDGAYTELVLKWEGIKVLVQSGVEEGDLVLLVTPQSTHRRAPLLVVEAGILWNRPGYVRREGKRLLGCWQEDESGARRQIEVFATSGSVVDPYIATQTPYLALPLDEPIGVSTGKHRTVEEIVALLDEHRKIQQAHANEFGGLAEVYAAIQTCMAWDTIYEPEHDRVVSPVSRIWNVNWGGFVLFDWDTYFAAYMAAIDNKELAYANAIEITREKTERGFVPNFGTVANLKSRDRSQPPVGSIVIREIYRKYQERWFLEEVFDDLLAWNRWWIADRKAGDLLCWGSDPFEPLADAYWEVTAVHERFGAALESGLDNSPMYDEQPFDSETNLMALADAGLNGMYALDCEALADIAAVVGRDAEAQELNSRAAAFRTALAQLWDEKTGFYLNRRTDTGDYNPRVSPTNFYPLMARAATQAQAERMIAEHFYNGEEFWGEWIMPSIARNDPAYPEQVYWRGRIWAPMNLLVYLGLLRYDLKQARADLAEKSLALLLKEWREQGHVHENYNADTGEGCDIDSSDRFYHWGGLLGLIAFIEAGRMGETLAPLTSR
jgi:putative isomerase